MVTVKRIGGRMHELIARDRPLRQSFTNRYVAEARARSINKRAFARIEVPSVEDEIAQLMRKQAEREAG